MKNIANTLLPNLVCTKQKLHSSDFSNFSLTFLEETKVKTEERRGKLGRLAWSHTVELPLSLALYLAAFCPVLHNGNNESQVITTFFGILIRTNKTFIIGYVLSISYI